MCGGAGWGSLRDLVRFQEAPTFHPTTDPLYLKCCNHRFNQSWTKHLQGGESHLCCTCIDLFLMIVPNQYRIIVICISCFRY